MKNEPILALDNVTKHFKTSSGIVHAVDNVSFNVMEGSTFALVGESGSGKSTTGHMVVGLYEPTAGKIFYKGHDISMSAKKRPMKFKKEIQIVFQDPSTSLNPKHRIIDILALPIKLHLGISDLPSIREEAENLMEQVQLPSDYLYRFPRDLGGGERQLVAIARALASQPKLIVLDEPTSALDVSVQAKIINTLIELQKRHGLTYLFITHDLSLVRNIADWVAIMYLGKVYELARTVDFFKNPLHPYTKMLLSSIPVISDEEEKLKPKGIESVGEIPSAVNPPKGCRFITRCPFATERCKEPPQLLEVEKDHYVGCWLLKQ